jgi:hypothetical protein
MDSVMAELQEEKKREREIGFSLEKSENALFCHSREKGNPGISRSSGLPLPAFAGTGFAAVTTLRTFSDVLFHRKEEAPEAGTGIFLFDPADPFVDPGNLFVGHSDQKDVVLPGPAVGPELRLRLRPLTPSLHHFGIGVDPRLLEGGDHLFIRRLTIDNQEHLHG